MASKVVKLLESRNKKQEKLLTSSCFSSISSTLLFAVGTFALQMIQDDLAHTHALRGNLYQLILLDVLQSLFQ